MAGDASLAEEFAAAYDDAARSCLAAVADLVDAFATCGRLTLASLANHGRAEARSVISGRTVYDGSACVAGYVAVLPCAPPSSLGGDLAGLPGWASWILDQVEGFVWPDADVDRLREAAACWRSCVAPDRRPVVVLRLRGPRLPRPALPRGPDRRRGHRAPRPLVRVRRGPVRGPRPGLLGLRGPRRGAARRHPRPGPRPHPRRGDHPGHRHRPRRRHRRHHGRGRHGSQCRQDRRRRSSLHADHRDSAHAGLDLRGSDAAGRLGPARPTASSWRSSATPAPRSRRRTTPSGWLGWLGCGRSFTTSGCSIRRICAA